MRRSVISVFLFLVVLSMAGCGYNTMQTNEEAVKAAWGDVEAAYQRRNDLIPNLVEVVKAYAKHRAGNPSGRHRSAGEGGEHPGAEEYTR